MILTHTQCESQCVSLGYSKMNHRHHLPPGPVGHLYIGILKSVRNLQNDIKYSFFVCSLSPGPSTLGKCSTTELHPHCFAGTFIRKFNKNLSSVNLNFYSIMLRLAVAQTRNADHYLNAPDSSSAVMHKPGAEPPGNTGFRSISRGPWTFPLISLALTSSNP
jgi:hypothetical protein